MKPFSFDTLPITPWRNGGGVTREIVSWPPQQADFLWRASIATIAQDGPFSLFPGIDRSITLLAGAGVHLSSFGQCEHTLLTGQPFSFSGDLALHATLVDGVSHDFNLMTRRDSCSARVVMVQEGVTLSPDHAGVVYVLSGTWRLGDQLLNTQQGAWWPILDTDLSFTSLGAQGLALWAHIL